MASPVTFCAVHKPLIRPSIASGVCVCNRVYCNKELTALSQPNSARQTTPSSHTGINPNSPIARNDATVDANMISPGRMLCASCPLVNAPTAAPRGIAAYSRPICALDICQLIASAGYNTRTALAMVNRPPSNAMPPISGLASRKRNAASSDFSGCSRGCGGGGNAGRLSNGSNVMKVPAAASP